jgi:cellulose synthase/poly-beta-1,6-N-acetylglucosamine synthase-like glycosyltransferase
MSNYRFLEMIPGLLAWTTIILMFVLSWLAPVFTAIFIILFDVYWLFKTIYLSFHLRHTFSKMRKNLKIDWLDKLQQSAKRKAQSVDDSQLALSDWQKIYHLVILPISQEPYEIIKESLQALSKINYPLNKLIVVLSAEEQAGESARGIIEKIQLEFGGKFFRFLTTIHPANLPNEIPGKGSNQTWAAKEVKVKIIDLLNIKYENILVSVFDADTQVLPDYFSRLTYVFLNSVHPQRSSFQPIPLFINNIFQAPALARVIALSSTFWHMIQQSRPERQITFSSHSMPFKAIKEIGFWQTNIVSEDSRIFWQCYLHYNGDWRVEPLFYPVSMDANATPNFWQTMINQYKQQRRWGWGCENIPYMLDGFRKNSSQGKSVSSAQGECASGTGGKKIPLSKKIYWSFVIIEGFHSWATNALIIFALGWLPLILGGTDFNFTLLSYNLPQITRLIMTLAMVGIATSAILSIILLPPKPSWFRKRHYVLYFLQWLLIPITLIVFGALPGLDSQTRLMLGGKFRLGFWFTPKHR